MIDRSLCLGCINDFYNTDLEDCWRLEDAELVERILVGAFERPPYRSKEFFMIPHCWEGCGINRYRFVDPKGVLKR